jgi:hypothetical protein
VTRPLTILLVAALSLALVRWLVVGRGVQALVPDPEGVAAGFVKSLSGRHYQAAHDLLSNELARSVSPDELARRDAKLRETHGAYRFELEGADSQVTGERANHTVTVKTKHGKRVSWPLSLERDGSSKLWKIVDFESTPLQGVAGK